jgi:hypothetical protein
MGEQPRILEHVTQRPEVCGQESGIVLPGLAIHFEPAAAAFQAGDAAQQRGLAAAGLAEEGGDAAARQVEVDIEREPGPVQPERRRDAHRLVAPPGRVERV